MAHMKPGQLFVLESTTYPGFTREVMVPMLEKSSGLKAGVDFHVAFSPERIDPGNEKYGVKNTTKIVGGLTPLCGESVNALYASFIDNVRTVSSPDCAEMVKLLENTFRAVNIGLVNEVALMCRKLDLNVLKSSMLRRQNPLVLCPSIQVQVLAAIAFRSIRCICRGNCAR